MINRNELRIGNYMLSVGADIHEVVYIGGIYIGVVSKKHCLLNIKDVNPIPLTEKWLLDFEFEGDNYGSNKGVKYSKGIYSVVMNSEGIFFVICNYLELAPYFKIQYVHHLQNLYFALTGEELTLKP